MRAVRVLRVEGPSGGQGKAGEAVGYDAFIPLGAVEAPMPYGADRPLQLYFDESCRSCRSVARVAARLGGTEIASVPIGSRQGVDDLADLPPAERRASAHLADQGVRYSGGALLGPLLSALVRSRSTRLASLLRRLDPLWDGAYRVLRRIHAMRP
jgi:predicted DCC family thiol-disulfide oxidoreductase YuxK